MSSTYRLLCLNHCPALVIDGPDWQDPAPAIDAALNRDAHGWLAEYHPTCDLLVGRYSASLVAVCCPAAPGRPAHGNHSGAEWVELDWLVLLHAASCGAPDDRIAQAIKALGRSASCWSWERLDRLAPLLGITDGGAS